MAGGGFGEAALMSAVIGGGVSAAKGEDPLKGAVLGGLLGGATGGIGNLLSPAATTAAGGLAAPLATEAVLASSLAAPAAETALLSGAANPFATQAATQAAQVASATAAAPALAQTQLALGQAAIPSITANAQQAGLVNAAAQIPKEAVTSPGGLGSLLNKFGNLPMQEKLLYGGTAALAAPAVMSMFKGKKEEDGKEEYDGPLKKFKYDPSRYTPLEITPPTPYQPVYKDYRNYAGGGLADLGGYSDYARGGRMLKGPGDGMSDNIPATIAGKQPARLANEEFVIPADVVSHLGNGSSEAGAKQLYKMMERVRKARTGNKKQGKQINPERYLA
jgi:hypothetical protein